MEKVLFQQKYEDWSKRASFFTKKVEPIINKEVKDISDDSWVKLTFKSLKDLNIHDAVDCLIEEIISDFPKLSVSQRSAIIDLYRKNKLGWASDVGNNFETISELEKSIIMFIIEDQGRDTRDAILALNHIINQAEELKLPIKKILKKVLPLASNKDLYGWGSTRGMLLRCIENL